MKNTQSIRLAHRLTLSRARRTILTCLLAAGPLMNEGRADEKAPAPAVALFVSGLNNPRGLAFGPGGDLYVAEGGVGGSHSTTAAECQQVPGPVGPYSGSDTGSRILRINSRGNVAVVADNLPSSQTQAAVGGFVSGIAGVTFLGDTLYALLTGAGCSHGVPEIDNGVLRVDRQANTTLIADLSLFYQAHPVAHPEPADFEPDGTPYSIASFADDLYVVEPNHGELDKINRNGEVTRIIDISATQGHVVPTALAVHGGKFYVGTLMPFPAAPNARVYQITRDGQIQIVAQGFTTILGLAFRGDQLYVLETSAPVTNPGPPMIPGTGRILRQSKTGGWETVVSGLTFPTAMTFGPSGDLYISNFGFGFPPGSGQILRVDMD
jgi:hypothetical protein